MTSVYIIQLLSILVLLAPIQGQVVTSCGVGQEYGVVVDVGSSGSRVRVYRWPPRSNDEDIPTIIEVYTYKKTPGFSTFSTDTARVRPYVLDLLNKAKDNVPSDSQSTTSLYFLATAGMRLLAEEDSNSLMAAADAIFSDTNINPFLYSSWNTRVLSGEEEGAFAWIALNYLRGYFTGEVHDSAGVLERGGASTQIAFVPEGSVLANKFPVRLGMEEYPLYVHSYLYYGQEIAFMWTVEYLVRENPDQTVFDHPCLLTGDVKYSVIDNVNITMRGAGDPEGCREIIEEYIYRVNPSRCYPKPCAIGPFYQPSIPDSMTFYAMSAFLYPLDAYGIALEDTVVSPREYFSGASTYCRLSLDEAAQVVNQAREFLSANCQGGIFTGVLFTKAYGFNEDTDKIRAVLDIDGEDINWTLGSVLYELGRTPVTCSGTYIIHSTWIFILSLSLSSQLFEYFNVPLYQKG